MMMLQAAGALLAQSEARRGNIYPAIAFLSVYVLFAIYIVGAMIYSYYENKRLGTRNE